MPKYSVVIACLNGAETLGEALDSLAAQEADVDWEVLFVDNGSTDASRAVFDAFAARHPRIGARAITVTERRGKAHALNVAIPQAGERVLFLDADDAVAPGWLAAMARALDRRPLVAARLDYTRFNPPELQAARLSGVQKSLFRLPHAPFCTHAGGATLGFHRRVFEEVGPFDLRFAALEDTDWCVRAHLKGHRIAFIPEAVYHYRFRAEHAAILRQTRAYAKHMALLRRLYAGPQPTGLSAALAWTSALAHAGALLARDRLARLGGEGDRLAAPRRAAALGEALGDLEGARAHGVPPLRRGFGALPRLAKARVRRAAIAALGLVRPVLFGVRTDARAMALTFDDGPDPETTPVLLDLLARRGAKATFFLIGARALRHPDLVARIAAEGHEIGNHSWSHPSLPTLPAAQIAEQLRRTREALGPHGGRLMRPPYGDATRAVHDAARALGYEIAIWNVNPEDWLDNDADLLARRILDAARPGAIVLLHDSLYSWEAEAYRDRRPTFAAVEKVIDALPDWRFVTVSELCALGRPDRRGWVKTTPRADLAALGSADAAAGAA